MTNSYDTTVSGGSGAGSTDSPGTLETAKNEASDLTKTAAEQGKDVVNTATHEAAAVAGEAKSQAKDLYAQTQRELKEQAGVQQQRVAEGLRSVGEELDAMASSSESPGVASDLVHQVSTRLAGASSWLEARDPGSLVHEVKSFARRKPGTFILAAVLVGAATGRLTRALATNAADEKSAPSPSVPGVTPSAAPQPPVNDALLADASDTPIYAQSSYDLAAPHDSEDGDVRRDTF